MQFANQPDPRRSRTNLDECPQELGPSPQKVHHPATSSSLFNTITILVGLEETKQKFILYESLLRRSSKYFDNNLPSKCNSEGRGRLVYALDQLAGAFKIHATFTMTGQILLDSQDTASSNTISIPHIYTDFFNLGARLQAHDFTDALIDSLHNHVRSQHTHYIQMSPHANLVLAVYTHS